MVTVAVGHVLRAIVQLMGGRRRRHRPIRVQLTCVGGAVRPGDVEFVDVGVGVGTGKVQLVAQPTIHANSCSGGHGGGGGTTLQGDTINTSQVVRAVSH